MSIRRLLLAGAAALAMSSCVTPETPLTADNLLVESFVLSAGEPFDVEAFLAAMPDWANAKYADARFDETSGAMIVRDLVFSLRDMPDFKIRIDRATIWGGDVSAVEALAANAVAGAPATIFERAMFEGVRSEGVQWEGGSQSAYLSMDKLVYDGLAARTVTVEPKEGAPDGAAILRKFAALALAYKFDGAAYSNLNLRMNESQGSEVSVSIAKGFVRGYDGGRKEYERVDGYNVETRIFPAALTEIAQKLTKKRNPKPEDKILQPFARDALDEALKNPIAFIAAQAGGETSKNVIDVMESRNVDIAGALGWLLKWELPPITETELIDLGSMSFVGQREYRNGDLMFSIDRSDIDAADFYWLIPSDVRGRDTGYNLELLDMVDTFMDMNAEFVTPETGSQEILQFREAIMSLGLETVRGDTAYQWNWNGATGALRAGLDLNVTDLASNSYNVGLGLPSLAEWDALYKQQAQMDEALKKFTFDGFYYALTDIDLLNRIFSYVAQESGGTAEEIRQAIPATLRASAAQAAEANPRIPGYIEAIAGFLESGGTIEFDMSPAAPVPFETLQTVSASSPETLPDVVNLTITHTPE